MYSSLAGGRHTPWAALLVTSLFGSTALGQQFPAAEEPNVQFASALNTEDEEAEPVDLESLVKRLAEAEERLNIMDEKAAKKKADDEKKKKEDAKKEKKWYDKLSIRGYAQFRYNYFVSDNDPSAGFTHAGDGSVGPDEEFLIRRARVILSGNVSDHLYVYCQPDFASTPDGAANSIFFTQIRDWYADIYFDKDKVHRVRAGQSKVPYGWENMQSSQNRLYLDRNDAFNSEVRNERDLGLFYYWTPEYAQEFYKLVLDENLKGSGNYGVFAFGAYNGQGGSLDERNDQLHMVARLNIPITLDNGQMMELGIQGITGQYVTTGAAILGGTPAGTGTAGSGNLDNRLGYSFIYYPQPIGFQCEWTTGVGPALNQAQTRVEERSLYGGYAMINAKYETCDYGTFFPFARWQLYKGGYKSANNSPYADINEWNVGLEWQIRKELELVCEYCITDRTSLAGSTTSRSYQQFDGSLLRFQLQWNY